MPYTTRARRRRGRPIGGPFPGLVTTRNLIRQSATMQTFITIPETTATGDFRFEFDVYPSDLSASVAILGTVGNTDSLRVNNAGLPQIQIGGSFLSFTGISVIAGRLYPGNVLERTGSTITLTTSDGQTANVSSSASFTVDQMFRRSTNLNYFNGFGANFNFVSGFSINATYPLDDTLINSNVIRNSAATLGDELWAFGVIQPDGSAASNDILAGVSGGGVPANTPAFLVRMSWVNLTGRLRLLVSTSTEVNSGNQTNGTGFVEFAVDSAANTRLQLQDQNGGAIADSVTITVREAPGYGTASASLSAQFSESYQVIDVGFLQVANTVEQTIPAGNVFANIGGFTANSDYRAMFNPALDVAVILVAAVGNPTAPIGTSQFDYTQGTGTVLGLNSSNVPSAGFDAEFKRLLRNT